MEQTPSAIGQRITIEEEFDIKEKSYDLCLADDYNFRTQFYSAFGKTLKGNVYTVDLGNGNKCSH